MKKVMVVLILFIFAVGAFFVVQRNGVEAMGLFSYAPCRTPITYRIGNIDQRFGLSEPELRSHIRQAEDAWEEEAGRDLFAYDPNAELKINLVYDKRQDLNNQINSLKSEVEEDKNALKPEIAAYEARSARFQERVENLNKQAEYWNSQGGAPSEEYDKLVAEQKALQQEAEALNSEARRLNLSSDNFAAKVDQLNQTVTTFNSALAVRPEEGLYDPNTDTISIYFHTNRSELVHTIAHELGHARGIGHVDSEDAVMYAQVNNQIAPTASDLSALTEVCRKRSFIEIAGERIQLLYQLYFQNRE